MENIRLNNIRQIMRYVVCCFVLLVYSTGYANVEEEKPIMAPSMLFFIYGGTTTSEVC